jgi:hypothetical protein
LTREPPFNMASQLRSPKPRSRDDVVAAPALAAALLSAATSGALRVHPWPYIQHARRSDLSAATAREAWRVARKAGATMPFQTFMRDVAAGD